MSNKIIFTEDQIDDIKNTIQNNGSIKSLAKKYDVSDQVISRIMCENNIHREISNTEIMRLRLTGVEDLEQQICDTYISQKITLKELGDLYQLSVQCVENVLERHNIERLKSSDFLRKYSINEDYFQVIDTKEKAYILGLLYTDGSISSTCYDVVISLQEEDSEILERINKAIGSNRPLSYLPPPKKFPHRKPQCRLVVSNRVFYEHLINHGLIPNKSYYAKFPFHINHELYKSFILGVFDGDGCLYHHEASNYNHITITGTSEICDAIGDIIEDALNIKKHIYVAQNSITIDKNTRVLSFGGNVQVKRFLDWLYDGEQLYMLRKYNKYCSIYNINNSLSS